MKSLLKMVVAGFAFVSLVVYADLRAGLESAVKAAESGDWTRSEQAVETVRTSCAAGDAGRRCRALAGFNTGWIASERARGAEGPTRLGYLQASAAAYEDVLAEHPAHTATVTNLALVLGRLGDTSALEALKARLENGPPGLRRLIAVVRADALADTGDAGQALTVLAESLDLGADPATVLPKMADVFGGAPNEVHAKQVLAAAANWGDDVPAAREYLLRSVCRQRAGIGQAAWNDALANWGVAAAKLSRVTAGDVDELFPGADERAIRDLADILAEAPAAFPSGRLWQVLDVLDEWGDYNWWTAGAQRRHALAAMALARGHLELTSGDPQLALRWWNWGLAVSPNVHHYDQDGDLRRQPALPLTFLTELAALTDRRKAELDPQGEQFDRYVNLLFQGKGSAYAVADMRSIQAYHTILGRIYAGRGVWQQWGPRSARFQLEHALRAAEQRGGKAGTAAPLPDLRVMLADGLLQSGDESDGRQASRLYAEAAEEYLDLDDLAGAESVLQRAVVGTADAARVAAISALVQLRKDPLDAEVVATDAWSEVLEPAFVKRQQFKLLADAAMVSGDGTDARLALTVAADLPALASRGDAIRIESIASRLSAEGAVDVGIVATPPVVEEGFVWQLHGAGGDIRFVAARGSGIDAAFPAVPVYFESGDVAVGSAQVAEIETLVSAARDNPEAHFTLTSTTDSAGAAPRNLELASERGEGVKAVLIGAGVAADRITVRALGESRETAIPTKDLERRVHVRLDPVGRLK